MVEFRKKRREKDRLVIAATPQPISPVGISLSRTAAWTSIFTCINVFRISKIRLLSPYNLFAANAYRDYFTGMT